jgi:hypothetical protein
MKNYIILPPDKTFYLVEFLNNYYRIDWTFERYQKELNCTFVTTLEERNKVIEGSKIKSTDYSPNSYLCLFSKKSFESINFLHHFTHLVLEDSQMKEAWKDLCYYAECQGNAIGEPTT